MNRGYCIQKLGYCIQKLGYCIHKLGYCIQKVHKVKERKVNKRKGALPAPWKVKYI
nr:MAG TPA: hypothetical protein [Caudoviricetes sp.]